MARASDRLVLSSTANCTVELTKIDYDQVGADTNDYIELKVTKTGGGLVTTLTDCGIGAIALYDDSSVIAPGVCVPYSLTTLGNVAIPSDGYIEVGQGAGSTVPGTIAIGSGADGFIHNGRGEIAILSAALPDGIPTSWLQYEGAAKCNLLGLPVSQIPTENDGSPNFTNVSCDSTFHLVNAANALPKTNADCPSGGAGGAGGNTGGAGGLLNLGGLLNFGGHGGASSNGGAAGLNASGAGGVMNLGGSAGVQNPAGSAGIGNGSGSGGAPSGAAGNPSATAGEGGTNAGGAAGSSAMTGDAGEAGEANPAQGGRDHGPGGSSSGASAGKADADETAGEGGHNGHGVVTQGGGCSCSVPSGRNEGRSRALIALAALLGACVRRGRRSSN